MRNLRNKRNVLVKDEAQHLAGHTYDVIVDMLLTFRGIKMSGRSPKTSLKERAVWDRAACVHSAWLFSTVCAHEDSKCHSTMALQHKACPWGLSRIFYLYLFVFAFLVFLGGFFRLLVAAVAASPPGSELLPRPYVVQGEILVNYIIVSGFLICFLLNRSH